MQSLALIAAGYFLNKSVCDPQKLQAPRYPPTQEETAADRRFQQFYWHQHFQTMAFYTIDDAPDVDAIVQYGEDFYRHLGYPPDEFRGEFEKNQLLWIAEQQQGMDYRHSCEESGGVWNNHGGRFGDFFCDDQGTV